MIEIPPPSNIHYVNFWSPIVRIVWTAVNDNVADIIEYPFPVDDVKWAIVTLMWKELVGNWFYTETILISQFNQDAYEVCVSVIYEQICKKVFWEQWLEYRVNMDTNIIYVWYNNQTHKFSLRLQQTPEYDTLVFLDYLVGNEYLEYSKIAGWQVIYS